MKIRRVPVLLASLLTLGACGSPTSPTGARTSEDPAPETPAAVESAIATPRLAITHDGGVMVVDVTSGDVVAEEEVEGFLRVSPAGDGRHAMVSGPGGWQVLDLGSWSHEHGDHGHHWTDEPGLTGTRVEAVEPGHVVTHEGVTTLFDDGTGDITSFDPAELAGGEPETTRAQTDQAHHGVAARYVDGNLLMTVGDEESRSGVRLVGPSGAVLVETHDCPGVHGEAFARDVAVLGCEDGAVLVDGREIRKVESPDVYGRVGNQAGSDVSPVLLGDYKTDADAELERPTRVALIDTRDASLRLVDLDTSYSFRSLGRGPGGEGLVLGTDGALHVLDPRTGDRVEEIDVVSRWREPLDWQQPRPTLHVVGATAYVTEPARDRVHVVDLDRAKVTSTIDLPHTPNEVVANAG